MTVKYDRRSGADRRVDDAESFSGKENRRRVEPRIPRVIEAEISESEWVMYFCRPKKKVIVAVSEEVTDIFGRSKN